MGYLVQLGVSPTFDNTLSAFLTFYLAFFVVSSVYAVRRAFRKRALTNGHAASCGDQVPLLKEFPDEDNVKHMAGYRRSLLGQCLMYWYTGLTLAILVAVVVVCLDVYGVGDTAWQANTLFAEEYRQWWALYLWVFQAVWYVVLVFKGDSLGTFFRQRCALADAEVVVVWVPQEVERYVVREHVLVRALRAVALRGLPRRALGFTTVCPVRVTPSGQRYIRFQHQQLLWTGKTFEAEHIAVGGTVDALMKCGIGLASQAAAAREERLGPNCIPVEVPSWLATAATELCSFFYVYQLTIMWPFFYWKYWKISTCSATVVAVSALITVCVKRLNAKSLAALAEVHTTCRVLRDGVWQLLDSYRLVPGDCIVVEDEHWVLPCDVAVLRGTVIMDESGLTGESLPQVKICLPTDTPQQPFDPSHRDAKKHVLFAGTLALRSEGRAQDPSGKAVAVVLTTGMSTSRGQLIAGILWPRPLVFKFDQQLPVLFSLLGLVAMGYFIAAVRVVSRRWENPPIPVLWSYAQATVAGVISPVIASLLVVGQSAASKRLRNRGIFCLNPQRITVSGKVRCMCFDKTGTLTKTGLEFISVCPISDTARPKQIGDPIEVAKEGRPSSMDPKELLTQALATCHSVTMLDGHPIGNEVEVNMFTATRWSLTQASGALPVITSPDGEVGLSMVKRFDFDHVLATMSVVVTCAASDKFTCFCKGSAERLKSLCDPATVPPDFDAVCDAYASQGFYVLALGHKSLDSRSISDLQRPQLESDLCLLGLMLFRNEPKPDAAEAILCLKSGDVRPVMITGDHVLTGLTMGHRVGMFSDACDRVLLLDVAADQKTMTYSQVMVGALPKPISVSEGRSALLAGTEVVMTGAAFRLLGDDVINPECPDAGAQGPLLLQTRVFARMQPEDKVKCVEYHMHLGIVTGMCGDGGNDCGALRTAHAGIALSSAEASIVSPFTSHEKTVMSVVDVLREGRGALATSFTSVKFQLMYGQVVCFNKIISYGWGTLLGSWEWIYLDACLCLALAATLTMSLPSDKLAPSRPTASLLSPLHICSVFFQLTIHVCTTLTVLYALRSQPWFVPFDGSAIPVTNWFEMTNNYESGTIFMLMAMEVLAVALSLTLGGDYRQSFYKNVPFILAWAGVYGILVALVLPNGSPLARLFQFASDPTIVAPLPPYPSQWKAVLLVAALLNTAVAVAVEKVLILGPGAEYCRRRRKRDHHIPLRC